MELGRTIEMDPKSHAFFICIFVCFYGRLQKTPFFKPCRQ